MENEKAKSEARQILDKFGQDLKGVKISKSIKEGGELRKEKEGKGCDIEFRTIMFKNAKRKNDECLILEKASW
ncbi:hypothetical protein FJZ21_01605 [Candidatus Pacearchaeota archaeon]|nr:hypothetical protein [Candidatus Pacearchaeota archaeon]